MKSWDFHKRPYRPVECRDWSIDVANQWAEAMVRADVFLDGNSRLWYAGTSALRALLPADPTAYDKIPPEFWHPDAAREHAEEVHGERKRELEDERIDGVIKFDSRRLCDLPL